MSEFWGKAAVMDEPTMDDRIVRKDGMDITELPIPITRSGYWNHFEASNHLGVVDKVWFTEEDGRTFMMFSGNWREDDGAVPLDVFMDVYSFLKYPAIYVSNLVQHERMVVAGTLRAINLVEDPAWQGCFIEAGALPERYEKDRADSQR